MKGIILYKTQYGSTEEYASWLAEATGLEHLPLAKAPVERLKGCDFLVIGSLVKIGRYRAASWIKRNWSWLQEKKVFIFSVSGTAAGSPELKEIMEDSLPEEICGQVTYFALPGRIDPQRLKGMDRFIMRMVTRMEKDPAKKAEAAAGYDKVNRAALMPLTEAVKQWMAVGEKAEV